MPLQTTFATLATIISIAWAVPYLVDVFRLKTTPHSYSWLVWTILQTIAVLAMWSAGAGVGVASPAIGAGLCACIFLLSLRYGTKNITLFDTVCLSGALVAIVVWFFLHNGLLAVVVVSVIDILAFLPTFRKTYAEPYSETPSAYFLSAIADGLSLFALSTFSVTTSLYLVTLVFTNLTCVSIIWLRRMRVRSDIL